MNSRRLDTYVDKILAEYKIMRMIDTAQKMKFSIKDFFSKY